MENSKENEASNNELSLQNNINSIDINIGRLIPADQNENSINKQENINSELKSNNNHELYSQTHSIPKRNQPNQSIESKSSNIKKIKQSCTHNIFKPIPFSSTFDPIEISAPGSAKSQMTPSGVKSPEPLVKVHSDADFNQEPESFRPLVVSAEVLEKENNDEEEEAQNKEQVIDTLLETLPSGRRLAVTPEIPQEDSNVSLVHEETIENLLHTLPSGRRLDVTPDASDNEEEEISPVAVERNLNSPLVSELSPESQTDSHVSPENIDNFENSNEISDIVEQPQMVTEDNINDILETLPNVKKPDVTPDIPENSENPDNSTGITSPSEHRPIITEDSINNLLETLPNVKKSEITPEIIEETQEKELKDEHIDALLETLPSTKRHIVTPSIAEEEEEDSLENKNLENIDTILQTLPANRRLVVTPEITDEKDESEISEDKIDVLLNTLKSTRRLDVTPDIPIDEDSEHGVDQENIDNILNTLSSSRRLDVTPQNEPNEEEDEEVNNNFERSTSNIEMIEEVEEPQIRTRELSAANLENVQEEDNNNNDQDKSKNNQQKLEKLDLSKKVGDDNENIFIHTETKSSKIISPKISSKRVTEEDSSDDEQRSEDQEALEKFSKTGKLPPMRDRGSLIREVQRERVEAIECGDYDRAQELYDLSKRVLEAVTACEAKELSDERKMKMEEQLERAKTQMCSVKYDTKNALRRAKMANDQYIEDVKKRHIQELEDFENKWNDDDFLRKFTKPSAELLALKDRERRLARAKLFSEAKIFRQKATELEIYETKVAQERAYNEMKTQKAALIQRQAKEMELCMDSAAKNYEIVVKKRKDVEEEQMRKIEAIQKRTQDGAFVKVGYTPSTARAMTSLSATRKLIGLNRNQEIPRLCIKKLGSVTSREKRKLEIGNTKPHSQFPSL